jgi:hypothetical protein
MASVATGLSFNPDGLRATGQSVRAAGVVLDADLGTDVPACGSDQVSTAIADSLNARRRWLAAHVRAGHGQALTASDGIDGTATGYQAEDAAAAAAYGGAGAPAAGVAGIPAAPAAPTGLAPLGMEIPDISGHDGEALALALEAGAGPGPAMAASARCAALAARADSAAMQLIAAQEQLVASGQSQAHAPLMARLTSATAWAHGVAAHASGLAAGYSSAATSHTATQETVGHSASWRAVKEALDEAIAENQATGGLAQPRVDALTETLTGMQNQASTSMLGYQTTGYTVTAPPAGLPDPRLNPNGDSPAPGDPAPGTQPQDPAPSIPRKGPADPQTADPQTPAVTGPDTVAELPTDPALPDPDELNTPDDLTSNLPTKAGQDMLSPAMGALSPLAGLAKANPLQSLGQAAQSLGQQVSKAGSSALHPHSGQLGNAAPLPHHPSAGLGGGGGIKGGAGLGGALHPAASSNPAAPTATPPAESTPKPATAAGAGAAGGAGMGAMPLGAARRGKSAGSQPVTKYPEEAAEMESVGRPGVVADTTKADPVVNPEAQNAVKQRMARRAKAAAGED